jgi:transposase
LQARPAFLHHWRACGRGLGPGRLPRHGRFERAPNITLLPVPPKAPDLNPVENVWEYLRRNQLSLRVWADDEAIVETCCRAWNALMSTPERIASITRRDWASFANPASPGSN